ncbi:MAG TPA: hypothetical protein DDZ60_03085 [Planktothrix sp. UBA10369]|nr:hypothetical protein [Planktothrix sp. UBA8402]HBK21517.1 hypothetical protein [Planktothrix sp. UBA10369]
MEDWSRSILEAIETAVSDMEKFLKDVTEELNGMFDELTKISEEITDEVQNKILPDLDEYINDIFEPIIDIYLDLDLDLDVEDEHFDPFVTYVQPTETEHPACRGCQHYHGQVYGGNLLVCGMHPMGTETETCPDWEG